jgi:ribosome-binding protein aMBF1 (putative translation factor)
MNLTNTTDPEREARRRLYRLAMDVAQSVYDLREATGLDQAAFAERVGLTATDIEDLEDADHRDPVPALHHIAEALGRRLELRIVAARTEVDQAAAKAAAA